eukprot:g28608.t1
MEVILWNKYSYMQQVAFVNMEIFLLNVTLDDIKRRKVTWDTFTKYILKLLEETVKDRWLSFLRTTYVVSWHGPK